MSCAAVKKAIGGKPVKNIDCTVVGDAMIDVVLPLPNIKDIYSLSQGGVTNTKMKISAGGSANVAFYISQLGSNSAFIGKVGDDYWGRLFLDDLRKNNITANVSISRTENTGVVFVLVFPDGERCFIDDRGANVGLKYEEIALDLIRDSKYIFFSGYSFQDETILNCIRKLLDVTANDTSIIFNPGAPNLAKEFRESFSNFIREYVSILILNEAEAKYLTQGHSENEVIDSLLSLADTVALTKGERGSIVTRRGERHEIAASPIKVVDTTGAGDAYTAGFIYGLSHGRDIKSAGEFASKVAREVVACLGARVELSGLTL